MRNISLALGTRFLMSRIKICSKILKYILFKPGIYESGILPDPPDILENNKNKLPAIKLIKILINNPLYELITR